MTPLTGSGVHRLFEGQERKEGHFSTCFGFQEGTLRCLLSPQEGSLLCFNQTRGQFSVFCQPRWHFSVRFGSQEGTLASVPLPPEGTLAYMLDPRRAL